MLRKFGISLHVYVNIHTAKYILAQEMYTNTMYHPNNNYLPIGWFQCGLKFCSICKVKWHGIMTCDDIVKKNRHHEMGYVNCNDIQTNMSIVHIYLLFNVTIIMVILAIANYNLINIHSLFSNKWSTCVLVSTFPYFT